MHRRPRYPQGHARRTLPSQGLGGKHRHLGPFRAADAITRIAGIENSVVIKTIKRADGSVNTESRRRPVGEFKKDCLAWLGRHRDEVSMPVETPPEPWTYTPEPFLPGLNVAFAMEAGQVADVYPKANLECRHDAEKHWENGSCARETMAVGGAWMEASWCNSNGATLKSKGTLSGWAKTTCGDRI